MPPLKYTAEEIAERGEAWYANGIRQQVETDENVGKILEIDIETGEYALDENHLVAAHRLKEKNPNALLYGIRIGYPAVYKVGGSLRPNPR